MAEPFVIHDLRSAILERLFPAVTVWNRLEGRPRTLDFDRALAAEVRDPLWLIARQWQLGEFRGDDAGSPVLARLHTETSRLTKYRPADRETELFETDVPLETKVERRPVPFAFGGRIISLDLRLLLGRHWLKLIEGIADYRDEFVAAYPIEAPDPTDAIDADQVAHPEVWQTFAALAGRRMDGGKLYLHLRANATNRAYDGVAGIGDGDKPALDLAAERFLATVARLFYEGAGEAGDAWLPPRLEYSFACSAPDRVGEKTYVAEEYYHGRLDWYSVDVDREGSLGEVDGEETAGLPAGRTLGMIPTPVQFEGMPNTRWWSFEDGKTNFGDVDAATTDLAKLLFVEFGLVYANDWFIVPCTVPAGSIVTVRGLAVTNVFGERLWIDAAGSGPDDDWQRWSMFTVSVRGESEEAADTSLLVLPTLPGVQEGDPFEEVYVVRDEMANLVWGIETLVPLASGGAKPGSEAATETLQFFRRDLERRLGAPPAPPPAAAPVRYRVMTSVPENWIPFLPVHVEGDDREIQLQRAALPRTLTGDSDPPIKVRPRTVLLREGLDRLPPEPYFVHEQEATRAGVRLTQTFARTRWRDGRVLLWLGVRKQTGRGPSSSGLAFDQLEPIPPEPSA